MPKTGQIVNCKLLIEDWLLGNLELAGFKDLSGAVFHLVDVYAAIVIVEWDCNLRGNSPGFEYFFSNKIINLEGEEFVVSFLKFEIDVISCGVGIVAN